MDWAVQCLVTDDEADDYTDRAVVVLVLAPDDPHAVANVAATTMIAMHAVFRSTVRS